MILHRPKDLDTAVSLACLQEEILEAMRWGMRWPEFPMGGTTTGTDGVATTYAARKAIGFNRESCR